MPLNKALKQQVITDNATVAGDTGSTEVQIAVLHARIQQITEHLKKNPKDFHSRRGLMMLVGKRRRLEGYLRNRDVVTYRALIQKLGIREVKPR
jgi:small subunit ribosomal protein S15